MRNKEQETEQETTETEPVTGNKKMNEKQSDNKQVTGKKKLKEKLSEWNE